MTCISQILCVCAWDSRNDFLIKSYWCMTWLCKTFSLMCTFVIWLLYVWDDETFIYMKISYLYICSFDIWCFHHHHHNHDLQRVYKEIQSKTTINGMMRRERAKMKRKLQKILLSPHIFTMSRIYVWWLRHFGSMNTHIIYVTIIM